MTITNDISNSWSASCGAVWRVNSSQCFLSR